jgi:acyl carrier protein
MQAPEQQAKFYATLSALLGVPASELGPQSSRHTVVQWDSLKQMHLMLALEEASGIEFDDQELASLDGAQAVLGCLAAKVA